MSQPRADSVREELDRILADEHFAGSLHLSRFLRFAVEETLVGRGESVKESVLGLEVFHRGADFDPRLDPIVRVQAAKLRTRLKEYYQGQGKTDPVIIELPKGAYVPVFRLREELAAVAEAEPRAVVSTGETPAPPRTARRFPLWVGIAVTGLAVVVVAFWATRRGGPPPQPRLRQLTFDTGSTTFPAISPDGKWLAYASNRSGKGDLDIWVQQVGGGEPVQLTKHEASDISPDFSPDGTRIVFRSNREGGGIYIISVLGTGERKLAGEAWRPRFSPDGNFIVYQGNSPRAGGDLYVIPSGGGQPRLVPIGSQVVLGGGPAWTPDGKHIVFAGARGSDQDWWVAPVSGGTPVSTGLRVALQRAGIVWPVGMTPGDWSGQRQIFALARENTQNLWEVSFSSANWKVTGSPRQITFSSAREDWPRLSRAGQIVFSSEIERTHLEGLPIQASAATVLGAPVELTHDASLQPGSFWNVPRFSANPHLLVYASERSGNPDVWVRDLASGSEAALTANPWPEDQPLLSRDGSRVAYQSQEGHRKALQVADLRSRLSKEVCPDCGVPEDWSLDDRQILYISDAQHAVYALDLASGQRSEVLRNPGLRFRHVTISPDGRWLAASPDGDPSFLVRLENGKAAERAPWKVISKDTSVESVHWSQDGKLLYFFSRRDDFPCLWAQRVDPSTGGTSGEAFPVQHFHTRRSPWSTWISVDTTKLVVRLTEPLSNVFVVSQ
jgi:Tol biopolymer transport system component